MPATPSCSDPHLVHALAGDDDALATLLAEDAEGRLARRHQLGPALALRAVERGLEGPALAAWRLDLLSAAQRHAVQADALARLGGALRDVGVGWVPIKGFDVATRVYPAPEARPAADLDVLIAEQDFEAARRALEAVGWRALQVGPRYERYVQEEGYAWAAVDPHHALLELHFRLWGSVPAALGPELLALARADPELPPGGRRLPLDAAWLVAAVHVWLDPPPRRLLAWWDLERIASRLGGDGSGIVTLARRFDLQLPVALAAEVLSALWEEPLGRSVADALAPHLAAPERRLAERARRRGPTTVPFAQVQLARLLAGRRSRHGWWGVARRLWPHPGVVEGAMPEGGPWWWRRLVFQVGARRRIG